MPAADRRIHRAAAPLLLACGLACGLVWAGPAPAAGGGRGLERDPVAATLAGEYALQAGRLDEAAAWALKAARARRGDAALAERAVGIAMLARDKARVGQALALWRASAPESLAMRGAQATLAMMRRDEVMAQRELLALAKTPAGSPEEVDGWRHALVALDAGSGDPALAGRLLDKLVAADVFPNELLPWLSVAQFAQQLQREDLVRRIVERMIARFPGEPAVTLLRAAQLREAGKAAEARAALAELDATTALLPDLAVMVAREYGELGDNAAAAAVLARGPQSERTYALRASYLAQAEDKAGVARIYDDLRRESADPDAGRRLLLGQIAEYIERYDEALDWYAGVPSPPQRWQARLRTTTVLHKLKRGAEAVAQLHALQTDATVDDETRRSAYLLEADLHREDGRPEAELEVFARGLAAYPDETSLLYGRALMWERRDDIARAEADFRRILALNPEDVATLNALGYTLADRTDRHREALQLISRAIAAEPDSAAIIDSYGWVLYRLGRKEEALVELRRAFTKQKDPEIGAHVGEVLWELGQKEEARRYFEESRKLDPKNRSLQRALEKTGAVLPPLPADVADKAGA